MWSLVAINARRNARRTLTTEISIANPSATYSAGAGRANDAIPSVSQHVIAAMHASVRRERQSELVGVDASRREHTSMITNEPVKRMKSRLRERAGMPPGD